MQNKLNVIIGRFQVPYLTEGHEYLIRTAREDDANVLILLGTATAQPTKRNPLPAWVREEMIKESFPDVIVKILYDHPSDEAWSKQVDELITKTAKELSSYGMDAYEVTLLGSRDSFKDHYDGVFPVRIIDEISNISGTVLREECVQLDSINNTHDFRQGIIYSVYNRYPTAYTCVDVIVTNGDQSILLGRKKGCDYWQLIGGFVDPTDNSFEDAARREVSEEASGLQVSFLEYQGNYKIDDHRYRRTESSIMTNLFKCVANSGEVVADRKSVV